jgi:hypothetical protein
MTDAPWEEEFLAIHRRAVAACRAGARTPEAAVGAADRAWLAGIGCSAQELYDFADDLVGYGEPSAAEALAVTALRREHFLGVLGGRATGHVARMEDLPPKAAAVDGIAWLPRLLVKARLKLRGEMPADLMYGCGGDRGFLGGRGIGLAEFLGWVRDAGGDDRRVIEQLKARGGGG